LAVPVVDITEAGAMAACLLGRRFGVATTLPASIAQIWDSLRLAGLAGRCAGVVACEVPVRSTVEDRLGAVAAVESGAQSLIAAGADVVVLGCGGFAGLDQAVEGVLGLPVVDGVAAGVVFAEVLVNLQLGTSKAGAYRLA
jgi:allantoin racemase